MGVVEKKGKDVTNLEIGDRVVASFQIACGECKWCKKKLSSFCDRTVRPPDVPVARGCADSRSNPFITLRTTARSCRRASPTISSTLRYDG